MSDRTTSAAPRAPLLALLLALLSSTLAAQSARMPQREVCVALAALPVQAEGRIWPLAALARLRLLQAGSIGGIAVPDEPRFAPRAGDHLDATEWLCTWLLAPTLARELPAFLVDDRRSLELVGLDLGDHARRDRYTFQELDPIRPSLERALAQEQDRGDRTSRQLTRLRDALDACAALAGQLDGYAGAGLACIPPGATDQPRWLAPDEVETAPGGGDAAAIAALEAFLAVRSDSDQAPQAARRLVRAVTQTAERRGDGAQVGRELRLLQVAPFFHAIWFQAAALLLLALAGQRRRLLLTRLAALSMATASALMVWGIVMRCLIRGRPPVTTLHESILMVSTVCGLIGLFLGLRTRSAAGRLALGLGAAISAAGALLAGRHESFLAADTLAPLQAVLDANVWLGLHVTTVTLGYSVGLFAGGMGIVHVLLDAAGRRPGPALGRMVHLLLCVALGLTLVGTALGGIWARDAWGRFWGWDPKENGALAICIWQLMALHARTAGLVRDPGTALFAVLGNVVIACSWWGINLLGIGLHSYGFLNGAARWLLGFCLLHAVVAIVAWVTALIRPDPAAPDGPAEAAPLPDQYR